MPFSIEIQNALQVYDDNKGFWRRLFRRDQAAIRALRTLSDVDQTNLLKIYQCFIENLSKPTQESYKVYQAVLAYLKQIDFSGIPGSMDKLHTVKLLKPENIDKIAHLEATHFQILENLLNQLSMSNLLTQENFDDTLEDIPKFCTIACAVNLLSDSDHLSQENLNSLLKKPTQALNMARVLKILGSNRLLIKPSNRDELCNDNNQFLLSDDAYNLVWGPLKTQLPILVDIEKQSVFDQLINLAQQENPAKEIESYMDKLKLRLDEPRSRANSSDKSLSAPRLSPKKRSSIGSLAENFTRQGAQATL